MGKTNRKSSIIEDMNIDDTDKTLIEQEVQFEEEYVEQNTRRKYDVPKVKAEAAVLCHGIEGVSAKIRHLNAQGWERGKIAVGLTKRYQHVRNVLVQVVKKG